MQLLQTRPQLHAVRSLSKQGVTENVTQLVHGPPNLHFFSHANLFGEELYIRVVFGKLLVVLHHLGQYGHFKFTTNYGSGFYGFFDQGRQTVDPGRQNGVDRAGQLDIFILDVPQAIDLVHQLLFRKILQQLLQVKGIAIGSALQQLKEGIRNGPL